MQNLIWYKIIHSGTIKNDSMKNLYVLWFVHNYTKRQHEEEATETYISANEFQCFTNDTTYHISVNESDCREKHDPSWIWLANLTLFQCILRHNAPVITFDQLDISSVYEKWISTGALQANFGKCILPSHSAFSRPIIQFSLHLHIKLIL